MIAADLRWFSDTVRIIYTARTHAELHERVLARLHPWFGSQATACESCTHDGSKSRTHQLLGDVHVPPDYFLYIWDNPNVVRLMRGDRSPVLQIRENVSAGPLGRTAWFNHIARGNALQDQMVSIVWGRSWFTSFGVNRDRSFTVKEREIFQLLHPHLEAGLRRVNAPQLGLVELFDTPWIELMHDRVHPGLTASQIGRFRRYFQDWRAHSHRLPEVVERWLQECKKRADLVPVPAMLQALWIDTNQGRFGLRYFPGLAGDPARIRIVEIPRGWSHFLATSGLTARECEVLEWLAQGKRNLEIGRILGISPFTVGKHVERVLKKLGVSNRAAAASASHGVD